jgi:hypothetical protein
VGRTGDGRALPESRGDALAPTRVQQDMVLRLNQLGFVLAAILLGGVGCGLGKEARAAVTYTPPPNLPASAFRTTINDGRATRTFRGAEMIPPYGSTMLSTPTIGTETSGTLTITYALEISNAIVSEGFVTQTLRDDWIWAANVEVDSVNPMRYCMGCWGTKSFPLAAAYRRVPADSVWVTWGGNYIKNPVIY